MRGLVGVIRGNYFGGMSISKTVVRVRIQKLQNDKGGLQERRWRVGES